jgi:hypothetical protein
VNYSKGISWIDDCRIPTTDKQQVLINTGNKNIFDNSRKEPVSNGKKIEFIESIGRFPANILVSDDMLNDGVISKSGRDAYRRNTKIDGSVNFMAGTEKDMKMLSYDDKGSNSRYYDIDKWFEKLLDV